MSAASVASAVPVSGKEMLARIRRGLRLVTGPFPHLAGLVAATRVTLDDRIPTMGVFASGRMIANPQFVARLKESDLVFVLAHEMLHLAFRTHERARGSDRLEFNYAHDYIINDLLRAELGVQSIPAHGLDMPGARHRTAEDIVLEMRRQSNAQSKSRVWEGETVSARRIFGGAGGKARGPDGQAPGEEAGDVLSGECEREMFPDEAGEVDAEAERVRQIAARALALGAAIGAMRGNRGFGSGGTSQDVTALRGLYRTPWQVAMQRWVESVAPSDRSFLRPSRRGTAHAQVVLPGRKRESWKLNVVLDTSGSMDGVLPQALGAIADMCDAVGIDHVRLVQCDAAVTADEQVDPAALATYRLTGYGGSDLSPAMLHLAEDPETTAVMVITDGDIEHPREPMPYHVLWLVTREATSFAPSYGHVLPLVPA